MINGVLIFSGHPRARENMRMVSGHLPGPELTLSRMLILQGLGVFWTRDSAGCSLAEVSEPGGSCRMSGALEGVITNRPELEAELGFFGDRMFPLELTDIQWILLAIREHGPGILARVQGEYALVAVDREKGEAVLAADPSGIGRMYWHLDQGLLSFSTSARHLISLPWVPGRVDLGAVSRGLVLVQAGPVTYHRDLVRSVAGHARVFCLSGRGEAREGEAAAPPGDSWPGEAGEKEAPEILLSRAILRRLPLSGRVALPADGAWDTALLAVLARRLSPLPLTCFSMSFGSQEPDSRARSWARSLGMEHEVIHMETGDLAARFTDYVKSLDEPAPSPAGLAAFAAFSRMKSLVDPSLLFCSSWERSLGMNWDVPFSPGWPLSQFPALSRWKSLGARFIPAALFPDQAGDSPGRIGNLGRMVGRLGQALESGPGAYWAAALDPTGTERRVSRRDACLGQGLSAARAAGIAIRFPFEDPGLMGGILGRASSEEDKERAFRDLARRLLARGIGDGPVGPGACAILPVEEILAHMERQGLLEPLRTGSGPLVARECMGRDKAASAVDRGLAQGGKDGARLFWMAVLDRWMDLEADGES